MATDYDAPRRTESDDVAEDSLDELKERRNDAAASIVDVDEADTAESFELPGADLSGEELSVRVVPNKPTSSPARPAFWSTTATATPDNATANRSATTAPRSTRGSSWLSVTSASTLRPSSVPVLVVVALVLGVPVLVVQVVDVIAVLHCLVAAPFSVYMISMLVRAVLF